MLWRWKSRSTKTPLSRMSSDVIELIERMVTENRLWGAERIRGELLKLGIHVGTHDSAAHANGPSTVATARGELAHVLAHSHGLGV